MHKEYKGRVCPSNTLVITINYNQFSYVFGSINQLVQWPEPKKSKWGISKVVFFSRWVP